MGEGVAASEAGRRYWEGAKNKKEGCMVCARGKSGGVWYVTKGGWGTSARV
jgi:hypothetical protein